MSLTSRKRVQVLKSLLKMMCDLLCHVGDTLCIYYCSFWIEFCTMMLYYHCATKNSSVLILSPLDPSFVRQDLFPYKTHFHQKYGTKNLISTDAGNIKLNLRCLWICGKLTLNGDSRVKKKIYACKVTIQNVCEDWYFSCSI